ncbi:MAG: hypothetical protein H7Y04_04125 [Verrucomicrobia bacterium]|nr:hypothetical protein [Cytophagales bacterium]
MTRQAKIVSGYILISVPTIIYGGYFLLNVLSGKHDDIQLTDFQKSMFRAGHGHAGLLVIMSLLAQLLVDSANLSDTWKWITRISFPASAILVSGGFFASAIGQHITSPNSFISLLYLGIIVLVIGLLTLGIGLIRK